MAQLKLSRFLNAPRARVFAAWTKPDTLEKWFLPSGTKHTKADLDFRVGGQYALSFDSRTVKGIFQEIVQDERLVFTWQWLDEDVSSLVTIHLKDEQHGTRLELSHEKLASDTSRDNHLLGWESSLEQLETYLVR
jgi:uncharacterized protein YndB with AHSA1/START domain